MLLNIYKNSGMSSHDVVDEIRNIMNEDKVGHGGTLDPFAEGVLIVGVGRESTKKLGNFQNETEKEYIAKLELGKVSETLDPEGELKQTPSTKSQKAEKNDQKKTRKVSDIEISEILSTLKEFEGEIEQVPPKYSAVKLDGTPAYKLARQGKDFELPPRIVTIDDIEFLEWDPPELAIRVRCGSGTYIRALARDIGKRLRVGAYLKRLVRTRVGNYTIEKSKTLKEIKENYSNQ
ncbi:MAG: tRNA pseudouridine(55) synthase TruB [Candidatus Magasanikbacteria bacterium]